jgi:2-dehydro-3-deoxygluconokinase
MAEALQIKLKKNCRWDCVSLGEVMLRFDPGPGRIHTTRTFQVWEGGGEYNVARGLKRCFGMDTAIVSALAESINRTFAGSNTMGSAAKCATV